MIRNVTPDLKEGLDKYFKKIATTSSQYDEGFPSNFESYLFLYHEYLQDRLIWKALVEANEAAGRTEFIYFPKEYIEGEPLPGLVVPNHDWPQLLDRIPWGLEFYLTVQDFQWLVWAYHEPCLHIGGSIAFVQAFREAYPQWRDIESPWYERPGVPECSQCGAWWRPVWGDWRVRPWTCPSCASRR